MTTLDPYATGTKMPWLEPSAPTALCAEVDPDIYFPEGHEVLNATTAAARAMCAECPLQVACADWAMREQPPVGIWGGLGPADRRRLARAAA